MGEIVKSGKIFLQEKSLFKSQWVEKFCVLHGKTAGSHPYMDFYENHDSFKNCKQTGKKSDKTIDLQHLKGIRQSDQVSNRGRECLIEILGKHRKNVLMLKNPEDCRKWSEKINSVVDIAENEGTSSTHSNDPEPDYPLEDEDANCNISTVNQMYESSEKSDRFDVEVESSDLATLCDIVGKRTLLVSQSELAFEDAKTRRIIYTFNFAWLRKYGKIAKERFHFEVGRKCPNGPGEVSCLTSACQEIHNLISKHSKNNSSTTTPIAKPELELPPKPVDTSGIGGPSYVTNMKPRHPGQANVPKLVPLPNDRSNSSTGEVHLRDSRKEDGPEIKFKKQLEETLHVQEEKKKSSVKDRDSINKKGSSKSKDEKKEKDKKEKEQEKDRKAKAKEEKKSGILGGLFSSKKEKDKDKVKEVEKVADKPQSESINSGNIYDMPETDISGSSNRKSMPARNEGLYDVADVPSPKPKQTETVCDPDLLYDDANSFSQGPVEYAQPFARSAAQGKADVYSDARDVEKSGNAWKQFARTEDEEHHTEDYSSIKSARGMQAPPIPTRAYVEDHDEEDDTYDRASTVSAKRNQNSSQNIYGTASGSVGDIVSVPSARTRSDSEGEDLYDDPKFDDAYETTENTIKNKRPVVDAYEEAGPPLAPLVPKSYNSETVYEEVGDCL